MALPSTSTGSKAWMPSRWSVGARFSSTGCSRITSSRTVHTRGLRRSTMRLADLMFWANSSSTSFFMTNGLNSSSAMTLGRPHWWNLSVGPATMTDRPEKSTLLPSRFWRNRPCLPLSMSDSDLSGRLPGPVTGRPRRPLSNRASTASWSIRFSLLTMMVGAPRSRSRLRRLFRLMTRRYRSFRSEVAKRPPSNCTMGRNSGGMTGTASRIMARGSLTRRPCWSRRLKAATIFSRLMAFCLRWTLSGFWPSGGSIIDRSLTSSSSKLIRSMS